MAAGALGLCRQGRNLAINVGFCFVRDSLNLYVSRPPHFKPHYVSRQPQNLPRVSGESAWVPCPAWNMGKWAFILAKPSEQLKQFRGWEAHEPPAPLPESSPPWGAGSTRTRGIQVHKMAALKQRGTRDVLQGGEWIWWTGSLPILPSWPCVSGLPCRALLPALTTGCPLCVSVSEELPSSSRQILEGNHHRS